MFPFTVFVFITNLLIIALVIERISERTRRGLLFRGPNFWIIIQAFSVSIAPIIYNYDIERLFQNAFLYTGLPIAIYFKLFSPYILTLFAFYFSIYKHKASKLDTWILPSILIIFAIHIIVVTWLYQQLEYLQLQLINHAILGIIALVYGGVTQNKKFITMNPIQNNSPSSTRQFWSVINFYCTVLATLGFTIDAFWQLAHTPPYHYYSPLTIASNLFYLCAAASLLMSSYMDLVYISQLPGHIYYYFRLRRLAMRTLAEADKQLVYLGSAPTPWHLLTHINIELYRHFIILSDSLTVLPKDSLIKQKLQHIFDLKVDYYQTLHLLANLELK